MSAPPLPKEIADLRARLQQEQAPTAKSRTNYFDMPALRRNIGPGTSSRRLPLNILYEMETDAVLQFADLVAMATILMGNWHIECRSARKAQFLEQSLRRIYGRWTLQAFGARRFGYQGIVKEFARVKPTWEYFNKETLRAERIWEDQEVEALIWDDFVPLRPELIEPLWTPAGDFDGIKIKDAGSGFRLQGVAPILMPDGKPSNDLKVDVEHALWVINERDGQFLSMWGRSRYAYAYKYWRAAEMTLAILNRSVERKGDPTIIVSYPVGTSRISNGDGGWTERDNQDIAEEIGSMARSGSVLLMPSNVWGEDDGESGKGTPKWKVETADTKAEFDKLESILGYLDVMKFRAMSVGEQAVIEGRGGTSSRNVASVVGERTAEAQFHVQIEHDAIINNWMIPQLSNANFWEPEIRDEPARKVTKTFGQGQIDVITRLYESYANANSDKLNVDWDAVSELIGVPVLSPTAIQRRAEELAKEAEQKVPEPVAPSNGNAGVTDTGFYVDDRERIDLAEDETLLASLPDTKHYSDRTVLANTRALRKIWADMLAEQYEDFAKHIESGSVDLEDVDLADSDEESRARKLADAIVKRWRFARSSAAVIKRTGSLLSQVFSRAGELELKQAKIPLDEWNPDEKDLAKWVKDNAAALVRSVEETTRKQLSTFLFNEVKANRNAPEIADNIRSHFSTFPTWRADLIAREEVRKFYNAATLFAAQATSMAQVQALDARLGAERSDPECIKRNGRFFSIEDAFKEEAKTHPRDTLAWRIIGRKQPLKVQRLSVEEMGTVGARVDRDEGIVYLSEGLSPEVEGEYLVQAGQWIEAVG